jgi:Ala-tRNA(Pro) deacylase
MISTENELLQFLEKHNISYQRVEHPPVYTCEEAELLRPDLPAVSTKNLFLCDKKGRNFYLVVTDCDKRVDLKTLAGVIGVNKIRFASERNLARLLGVTRGAVTVLGLVNDVEGQVGLWVDEEVWSGSDFMCHPLVNTATLVLSKESLERFFALSGHRVRIYTEDPS